MEVAKQRQEMSSLDLLFLQRELKFLCGGRIEKIYQFEKALRIEIFLSGKGNFELYFEPGKLFITEYKRKAPEFPSHFCMLLRKHLEGQKILGISQKGFERIVEIFTEKNIFILELFSKGNAILCDNAYNIIMPMEVQLWKDRELLPKRHYKYPPTLIDPFSLDLYNLKKILSGSEKNIVSFLATNLGLSGTYAEEVCARAGVDKNKKCKEVGEEAQKIFDAIQSLLKDFKPQLVLENEKIIDFAPFDLKIYEGKQEKNFQTLTHALDEFFTEKEAKKIELQAEEKISEELQRFERVKEEQKEAIKKMKKREEEARKKAEAIYNNFEIIENIISAIDKAKRLGLSWDKIKQHIAEEDTPETRAIKEIKEDDAVIALVIGKTDIDIDFRKTPQENAEEYYEEAKKLKKKTEAAQDALKKTNKEIRRIIRGEKTMAEKATISTISKRKRGKWYEKFRWFFTTEGFLVIGGRDATQNEMIFKKYLLPEDIVLHADIAGAPLTAVKSEGKEITALAIREAAELAAAYSSAWKEKLAAIDVYWVKPEQVSKSPPSGEYLPKGSFTIRGEKNYLKKTELKISIGIKFSEEGVKEAKPICGSVQSASKHAKYFVTVFPGDTPQQELAKQIINKILVKALPEDKPLIEKIPIEDVQRLIPAGGGTIVG